MKPESDELDDNEIIHIPDHRDLSSLRIYTRKGYTDLQNIDTMCEALDITPETIDAMVITELFKLDE
ncbi:MAG: hypothetical protein IKC46_11935 [Lachnospiraceae bacterium]|nr:hypothetical protein [Lachnospiraceae bacterium]